MTLPLWDDPPWGAAVEDSPLARLAWDLRIKYRCEKPPHLAVETLADELQERFGLEVPLTFDSASDVLTDLGILINITRTTKNYHAEWRWHGTKFRSRMIVNLSDRDAETRQTLSLMHELYEILREYFHEFGCARFSPELRREDYVCETMARRFSAAIGLPRAWVRSFIQENGLNVPLLVQESGRSHACVVRRLRDLLGGKPARPGRESIQLPPGVKPVFGQPLSFPVERHPDDQPLLGYDVPFVFIRCLLRAPLLLTTPPRFECTEHVRSVQMSIRPNRSGVRSHLLPRKGEQWALGPLVERVLTTHRPAYCAIVHRPDLLGWSDLAVLALPEMKNNHLHSVALYAIRAEHAHLWEPVVGALGCDVLTAAASLVGIPVVTRKPRLTTLYEELDIVEVRRRCGRVPRVVRRDSKMKRGLLTGCLELSRPPGAELPLYARHISELEQAEAERRSSSPVYRKQVQLLYIEEQNLLTLPARGAAPEELLGPPAARLDPPAAASRLAESA